MSKMKSPEPSENLAWKLLDHATHQKPSASFPQNVLRAARVTPPEKRPIHLFTILAPSLAAIVLFAGILFSPLLSPTLSEGELSLSSWDDEISLYLANEHMEQLSNEELALALLY